MIENIARIVSTYALLYTGVFCILVMAAMIFNRTRRPRPRLDIAFIVEKAALAAIALWGFIVLMMWVDRPGPWVRMALWLWLSAAETAVLWYLYCERLGRGFLTTFAAMIWDDFRESVRRNWRERVQQGFVRRWFR